MMSLSCKTSVCSFGHSIGEKIEKLQGVQLAANQVAYQSFRTPLCEFLANFLVKLKRCGDLTVQNNVLENFSILQVKSIPPLFLQHSKNPSKFIILLFKIPK